MKPKSYLSRTRLPQPEGWHGHSITISDTGLVTRFVVDDRRKLPYGMQPGVSGVDLGAWVAANAAEISRCLTEYGGILFRGFPLARQEDFHRFLTSISAPLVNYTEGATPRKALGNQIYTSTEYPPEHAIALHNELSYTVSWPQHIWFCCITPAEQGGETPIADMRRVYERIDPAIREDFRRRRWMLVRNYTPGLGLDWQATFHTNERSAVESYCRGADITCEWKSDNHLRTRQVRPAIAIHPQTQEPIWFNHIAFWNVSTLDPEFRDGFLANSSADDLPYNTYYGDGGAIEPAVIESIVSAYQAETVYFPWQKGDLLWLDNMLVAHGRNAFTGTRRILAAMGRPCSDRGVD
jgi:alpha-ketoglutarate-dependent taurine dioxygenase